MNEDLHRTALKIVGMSDRGEVTLSGVEKVLNEFIARGIASQKPVDTLIADHISQENSDAADIPELTAEDFAHGRPFAEPSPRNMRR